MPAKTRSSTGSPRRITERAADILVDGRWPRSVLSANAVGLGRPTTSTTSSSSSRRSSVSREDHRQERQQQRQHRREERKRNRRDSRRRQACRVPSKQEEEVEATDSDGDDENEGRERGRSRYRDIVVPWASVGVIIRPQAQSQPQQQRRWRAPRPATPYPSGRGSPAPSLARSSSPYPAAVSSRRPVSTPFVAAADNNTGDNSDSGVNRQHLHQIRDRRHRSRRQSSPARAYHTGDLGNVQDDTLVVNGRPTVSVLSLPTNTPTPATREPDLERSQQHQQHQQHQEQRARPRVTLRIAPNAARPFLPNTANATITTSANDDASNHLNIPRPTGLSDADFRTKLPALRLLAECRLLEREEDDFYYQYRWDVAPDMVPVNSVSETEEDAPPLYSAELPDGHVRASVRNLGYVFLANAPSGNGIRNETMNGEERDRGRELIRRHYEERGAVWRE